MSLSDNKGRAKTLHIYYYVSGHGYGHISRTSVILKKLLSEPNIESIHLISDRIEFIDFEDSKLSKRKLGLDVGIVQKDSLSLDIDKTKEALIKFENGKSALITAESLYCRKNNINLIITDVASLPIVIALEAGIPSLFIGNFTWDFIYKNYAKTDPYFGEISERYQTEYSFATEALFLPFTCPMEGFLDSSFVGLVGREPTLSKSEARKKFGFSTDKIHILLSFGAYGLTGFAMEWENLPDNFKIVAYGVPGLAMNHVIEPETCYYPDLITAVDYVLTKPGYGILSECYYAKTPILYTERGDFAEYPYLVKSLKAYFSSQYISHSEISTCLFESIVSRIDRSHSTGNPLELNGENDIIKYILEYA